MRDDESDDDEDDDDDEMGGRKMGVGNRNGLFETLLYTSKCILSTI